jgi:hypothetical protein
VNGLEQFQLKFSGIPMKMIPFIRRSDLTTYLSIHPTDVPKIWNAIQQLKREFPPPIETIDDSVRFASSSSSLIPSQHHKIELSIKHAHISYSDCVYMCIREERERGNVTETFTHYKIVICYYSVN